MSMIVSCPRCGNRIPWGAMVYSPQDAQRAMQERKRGGNPTELRYARGFLRHPNGGYVADVTLTCCGDFWIGDAYYSFQ